MTTTSETVFVVYGNNTLEVECKTARGARSACRALERKGFRATVLRCTAVEGGSRCEAWQWQTANDGKEWA